MTKNRSYLATHPQATEDLLREELVHFGAQNLQITMAGIAFCGDDLSVGYRACLWSRLANRVILLIHSFEAADPEALYAGVSGVNWGEHMHVDATLGVDVISRRTDAFRHRQYAAQKVKDAIVDQFRREQGRRPSVDTKDPDLRVHVQIDGTSVQVGIDLSGQSLHRRGYRLRAGPAPLKENIAAALLMRARWPQFAAEDAPLIDPMCGSGTLLVEAALMAQDIAPGLLRQRHGFERWAQHDRLLWQELREEAKERRNVGAQRRPVLFGFDQDPEAIRAAKQSAAAAGVEVAFACQPIEALQVPAGITSPGLIVTNPPYGERLGELQELTRHYGQFGAVLKEHFGAWKAVVLTANETLTHAFGLGAERKHTLFNGALRCQVLTFAIHERAEGQEHAPRSESAQMLANRLRKNQKHFGKWSRKNNIACYRLYDADLPEYAFAVDIYDSWAHVQEYDAPQTIDERKARKRRREALQIIAECAGLDADHIYFKVRQKQKGKSQYEKVAESQHFRWVQEGGHWFLVNLSDYLDTGLFLDHRLTRALIEQDAKGKRFLNLFAYTGAASVYAAKGGARSTTTVDLSKSYLEWAQKNFRKNDMLGKEHEVVHADCITWLRAARCIYDLVFLDPPTFSNSKRMAATWEVQRDHVELLLATRAVLRPQGQIIFSTNFRKFKLDTAALEQHFVIDDWSARTLPEDFRKNPKIHRCYLLSAK